MQQIIQDYYQELELVKNSIQKKSSRTVSTLEFKETIKDIFTNWKTRIKQNLEQIGIFDISIIDDLDSIITRLYAESKKRVSRKDVVLSCLVEVHDIFFTQILIPLKTDENLTVVSLTRQDLLKRLTFSSKNFTIANDYFEEAKSCFKFGFFRAATIVAISSLESCLKSDYSNVVGSEYSGKFYTLLNRYFSGDIKRLPIQYEDFAKTHVKIRNSFTHPESFDYSESIVFNVLSTVMELTKSIDGLY